jgi:CRISPR-associated protein (TIGR03986 family)
MAETFEGTAKFDEEKKDWFVAFTKHNNNKGYVKCLQKNLSAKLLSEFSDTSRTFEVKFEADKRNYNELFNIQLKNEETTPKGYKEELETQQRQEKEASANRPSRPHGKFHNPYNFVPAIPRKTKEEIDADSNLTDEQKNLAKQLCDDEPIGHDRFHKDHLSGKLTVKMTVKTPLAVLDTARMSLNSNDPKHKQFPVRIENGKPFINPTAIKGMLRSAYETVTNSRMSVFSETERLAFRMEADTTCVYPALIVKTGNNLQVKLLVETPTNQYDKPKKQIAKLDLYDKVWNMVDNDKGKSTKSYSQMPQHYSENGKHQVWVNCHFDSTSHSLVVDDVDNTKGTTGSWKKGWIYISGSNMKDKRYERVFLDYASGKTFPLGNLEKDWKDLIANYQKIHEKEIEKRKPSEPQDYLGDDPGETAWSRQIYDKDYLKLEDGTLCYAFYNGKEIEALLPVMISRRMFPKTPNSLLPEELQPAKSIEEFSSADRVFGYVIQEPKNKKKTNAYRGQLRIGSVVLSEEYVNKPINDIIQKFGQETNPDSWLPLNILGQPKPQQGRFYVAKDKEGKAQVDGLNNENAGYNLPLVKGLRGRKVYPHHASLSTDYWTIQNNLREYNEPNKEYVRPFGEKQRDSQNRSIEGWIKPQTKFEFDIHFTNLSEVELGALVWLLDLPEKHFHRFGGGKPYGFGSVKLEITDSDVRDGKDLEKIYMSLDDEKIGKFDKNAIKTLGDDFKKLADSMFPKIIKSFLCASEGFSDNKPIHYPRKDPKLTADTKSFEWFVANNKIEKGTVKHGYVLQDLADDEGLPYLS